VRFEVEHENGLQFGIRVIPNWTKILSKMTRKVPENALQNVGVATCFKNLENSGFYP
jgi:hypothetical protein